MADLPDELLSELLSLQPINHLLKLRSISKSWRCLIESSYFFNIHHKKQQQLNHSRIVVLKDHKLYYFNVSSKTEPEYKEIRNPFPLKNSKINGIQSCNGVLCTHYPYRKIVIWNPLFNKYRELHSPVDQPHSEKAFGFGYDRVTNDYKLVVLQHIEDDDATILPTIPVVYSLKLGRWEKIDGFCDRLRTPADGVFVGDSLHWLTLDKRIVAFNLTTHKFHYLALPGICSSPLDHIKLRHIGEFQGCLSLTCTHTDFRETIFTMEPYGAKDSWTTRLRFHSEYPLFNWNLKLMTSMENGIVLLREGFDSLLLYDTKIHRTIRKFVGVGEAHTYVTTLGLSGGINNEGGKTKGVSKAFAYGGIRKKRSRV